MKIYRRTHWFLMMNDWPNAPLCIKTDSKVVGEETVCVVIKINVMAHINRGWSRTI